MLARKRPRVKRNRSEKCTISHTRIGNIARATNRLICWKLLTSPTRSDMLGGRGDDDRPDTGPAAPRPDRRRGPPPRRRPRHRAGEPARRQRHDRAPRSRPARRGRTASPRSTAARRLPDERTTDEPGFEAKSLRNMGEKSRDRDGRRRDSSRPGWRSASPPARPRPAAGVPHRRHRRSHRRHQLGPGRRGAHAQSQRPDRTVVLTGGIRTPSRRARRPGRGQDAAHRSTSTWSSWACTASPNAPVSGHPTSWRPRPTGRSSPPPIG